LKFYPTPAGGRVAEGVTPYGRYRVEWDADGRLLSSELELRHPDRGLGDTVARLAKATGMDRVAQAVATAVGAKDCGCAARQARLNTLLPYPMPEHPPIDPER
jgi:YD repeat-containing protein